MEDDLTGLCIVAGFAVGLVLVALPYFQTFTVRDKVAYVHSITVEVSGSPQELSVVVDAVCAGENFLLAVVIAVSHHYVMVAAAPAGSISVEG